MYKKIMSSNHHQQTTTKKNAITDSRSTNKYINANKNF